MAKKKKVAIPKEKEAFYLQVKGEQIVMEPPSYRVYEQERPKEKVFVAKSTTKLKSGSRKTVKPLSGRSLRRNRDSY